MKTFASTTHELHFPEHAWQWWLEAGYTAPALASVIPARRMQQREPAHIDGKLGYYSMAIETAIIAGTWQAATGSASCAYSAAEHLQSGHSSAFALCRPPGHHAGIDLYGGYCFINEAAVAAQHLLDRGASRVVVLAQLKLPTLFVMEGGYAVSEIGTNTVNVLNGFESASP